MKKLLALLLISMVFISTGCQKKVEKSVVEKIQEKGILTVGVKTDSKPFGFLDENGNHVGFDIDIAKAISQDILGNERRIKYVSVSPNSRIEDITSGKVDIIVATMTVIPQREYLIQFSKPYYVAGQTALVRDDSDIYTFADLRKKTTIVVLGTTAEQNIRRIIPTAKIVGYKTYEDAFNAFLNEEGDAISTDDTILLGFLQDYPDDYRILKNRISKELYAVGMKQQENDDSLMQSVDGVITRMTKNGSLRELKTKWQLEQSMRI